MAFALKHLKEAGYLPTAVGSGNDLYANPASTKTYVRLIILHNTNSTTETVTLYCQVPDNAGARQNATATQTTHKLSLAANETVCLEFPGGGIILEDQNETVQGITTTASKVTVSIFGGTE